MWRNRDESRDSAPTPHRLPPILRCLAPARLRWTGPAQTFGLISYNLTDLHARARALYVSSGVEVKDANNMIDAQPATAYSFAANDASPTTIIDLGTESKLRRLSAIYSPQQGSMEFYVLRSLPNDQQSKNLQVKTAAAQAGLAAVSGGGAPPPNTLILDDSSIANMTAVGSITNSGSEGRASVNFPETSGRYVMVKWIPASHSNVSFSVAEIAAFGGSKKTDETVVENDRFQGTRIADSSKGIVESKDVPEPPPPGEGPPPPLPIPPTFTFIPDVSPTPIPTPTPIINPTSL